MVTIVDGVLNWRCKTFRFMPYSYSFKGSMLVVDTDEGLMPCCRVASGSLKLYTPKMVEFDRSRGKESSNLEKQRYVIVLWPDLRIFTLFFNHVRHTGK